MPVADGGDGTLESVRAAGFEPVSVRPTGIPVDTCYARKGGTAVVQMANVSGLARLPGGRSAPMTASSRGTGEVVADAVEAGCRHVVLGVGGSASTDGGAGLVRAFGVRLQTCRGAEIADGGGALVDLRSLERTHLRSRMDGVTVTVACDVDNPLTGEKGAAAVYGPQKGADGDQVAHLDRALTHWAGLVSEHTAVDHRDEPGAGAAGGASLVVTGEGALDRQTLHGKAPAGVAAAARPAGVPVVAVTGGNSLETAELHGAKIGAAYALNDEEPDLDTCMRHPVPLLERLGERIAAVHLDA